MNTHRPTTQYSYASMRTQLDLSAYLVIGPDDTRGRNMNDVVDQALRAGITCLQLRAKHADARTLTAMARELAGIIARNHKSDQVAFVINDRVDVAWQCRNMGIKVDGVHIGQDDLDAVQARMLLGDDAIIGLSAQTQHLITLSNALPTGCIDYIGAGPLHHSTSKPQAIAVEPDGTHHFLTFDIIRELCAASSYPIVVGGGVTVHDVPQLAQTQAAGWFVISAIAGADNPYNATRALIHAWQQARDHHAPTVPMPSQ